MVDRRVKKRRYREWSGWSILMKAPGAAGGGAYSVIGNGGSIGRPIDSLRWLNRRSLTTVRTSSNRVTSQPRPPPGPTVSFSGATGHFSRSSAYSGGGQNGPDRTNGREIGTASSTPEPAVPKLSAPDSV